MRGRLFRLFNCAGFALLITASAAWGGADITGRVVGVTDGDTITVLSADKQAVKVRLREIDAPEHDQPWGQRAKRALSDLVYGREVRVTQTDHDRYGRTLGRVFVGDLDVSARMVASGYAWAYRPYVTDSSIPKLESEARASHRGLWSLPDTQNMPPWEWRREGRKPSFHSGVIATQTTHRPLMSVATQRAGTNRCGAKRTCREMSSCAEARFYLTQCGVSRLDSDGDGTPCESLCH